MTNENNSKRFVPGELYQWLKPNEQNFLLNIDDNKRALWASGCQPVVMFLGASWKSRNPPSLASLGQYFVLSFLCGDKEIKLCFLNERCMSLHFFGDDYVRHVSCN